MNTEGPQALYKGLVTHFLRLGPHFCLTFVFLGILRRGLINYRESKAFESSFSFVDVNRNGRIEPEELALVLKNLIPYTGDEKTLSSSYVDYEELMEKYAKRIFHNVDATHRGFVTQGDMRQLSTVTGRVVREHHMRRAFDYFDKDKSGLIDPKDLKSIIMDQWKSEPSFLHNEEKVNRMVERLLEHADTAKDGHIDYQEFSTLCEKMTNLRSSQVSPPDASSLKL
jgi:Ca2+-binding EF-hand superfamily protein